MSGFVVAIPARLAASRLPDKPLRLLGGRPLIVHVAERALAAGAREVWVACDHARIADALAGCGVRVAMTAADHASGTDRLAECARIAGWEESTAVVNLQGDEPFAPAAGIRAVAALLDDGAPMSTLATPITDAAQLLDPNAVKVVRNAHGDALYFSRAPMPWPRDAFARDRSVLPGQVRGVGGSGGGGERAGGSVSVGGADGSGVGTDVGGMEGSDPGRSAGGNEVAGPDAGGDASARDWPWLRHIGIYGYRAGFLQTIAALPQGRLERIESLEQLRVLEAGHRIAVGFTPEAFPPGVDTPEDLERAEAHLRARPGA